MRITENITFLLVHLSLILCIVLAYLTWKRSQRNQMKLSFYMFISVMFVWNLGTILEMYSRSATGISNMIFVDMCYVGICLMAVAILYLGVVIANPQLKLRPAHSLILVIPIISIIMVCTNGMHHLFFENFSVYSAEAVYGPYYYFHTIYSYGCIFVGILYLISFTVRSSGVFSKQSITIILGILIPLSANVLYSFNIIDLSFSVNASMFTITLLCFAIAFFKYDFLQVAPIALQRIVDLISDGYIVVDKQNKILDYNSAMLSFVPDGSVIPKGEYMGTFMLKFCSPYVYKRLVELQKKSVDENHIVQIEYRHIQDNGYRYFAVEITPIFQKHMLIGSIILLKDVTQAKRDLELIKETQIIMLERERLASLGQMVGGIAHNLKTPILSISGGVEAMRDLTHEYEEAVDDPVVTKEDHHEIAREMRGWMDKIKIHCAYISDMITTIKGQAVQFNINEGHHFTIDEFLKRVDLLMKHELKKYHCTLRSEITINVLSEISGDINSLVQIFDNLIINAIHAYNGEKGFIDLNVREDNGKVVFTLRDYGQGMTPSVKSRLFKEMVTTKGKNGTGLGLYLSYSTIKGHFHGSMEVESTQNKGTTFTVTIPLYRSASVQGNIPEHKEQANTAEIINNIL